MAWLTGWGYRKSHIINPATGAGTNYQVCIIVHYGSGVDGTEITGAVTAGKVYCNNHPQIDFDDIRFTKSDGETLLDYYLEYKVNSDYAIFWVEITDSLESNPVDIYVYYGKDDASSISNGVNTFIQYHGATTDDFIDAALALGTQIRYRCYGGPTSASHNVVWGVCGVDSWIYIQSNSTDGKRYVAVGKDLAESKCNETPQLTSGTSYYLEWFYSTTVIHGYVDGDEISTGVTTNLPTDNMGLRMWTPTGTGQQVFSFVAKYVTPEPAHSTWGTEEEPVQHYERIIIEYLSCLDSWTRTSTRIRNFIDYIGNLDIRSGLINRYRIFLDIIGNLDTKSKLVSRYRTFIDYFGNLDIYSRVKTIFREIVELLGLKDTQENIANRFRTFIEYLGNKDTVLDYRYFHGVTRDSSGNRLGNCEVKIFKADGTYVGSTTSDDNGDFTIYAPKGDYYFMRGYKSGTPNKFGTTDEDLGG